MWFKNLYCLQLPADFSLDSETLAEALASKPFKDCHEEQRESSGFVSPWRNLFPLAPPSIKPLHNSTEFLLTANNCKLFTLMHQERLLPSAVVREELDKRIAELEVKESRKIGNKEKKELREQIEFELLPQAFTRTKKLDAWLDTEHKWLVLNTASSTHAERLTKLLRIALGSLPVIAPKVDTSPTTLMTQWLREGEAPAPFALGEDCELRGQGDEKSVAVFKRHELTTEEVHKNLEAGKVVSKLGLVWDEKISFILTDELHIRRVRFLDVLADKLEKADPQSKAEKMDIEFTLMTGEVSALLADLMKFFVIGG